MASAPHPRSGRWPPPSVWRSCTAGGWWANSLALLSDAGHMLSDAVALGLSIFAMWIARTPASPRKSYGYYRAEILAAMANGATLIAVCVYVVITPEFWVMMQIGMMAGFVTSYPVNWWLLRRGIKEVM